MGLDMYLERRTYVQRWEHIPASQQFTVIVWRGGIAYPKIKLERVTWVTEQVAYWRKANAIHAWFVREVQQDEDDCREHYVENDKLRELLATVETVLANPGQAEELLPTQQGFFFGGTDYDEDYIYDLEDTRRMLTEILAEDCHEASIYYRASW